MHLRNRIFRTLGIALIALTIAAPHAAPLSAGMIGTGEVVRAAEIQMNRATMMESLDHADVRGHLVAMGVDPEDARERIARLTDDEIVALSERGMDEMPAGASPWGWLAAVFIVFIITDAVGYTDVFSFVGPSR